MKKPILKNKMTKLGAALLVLSQSPELIQNVFQTAAIFNDAANQGLNYLALVGAAGVIWGGIRRAFNYFGK